MARGASQGKRVNRRRRTEAVSGLSPRRGPAYPEAVAYFAAIDRSLVIIADQLVGHWEKRRIISALSRAWARKLELERHDRPEASPAQLAATLALRALPFITESYRPEVEWRLRALAEKRNYRQARPPYELSLAMRWTARNFLRRPPAGAAWAARHAFSIARGTRPEIALADVCLYAGCAFAWAKDSDGLIQFLAEAALALETLPPEQRSGQRNLFLLSPHTTLLPIGRRHERRSRPL